MLTKKMMPVVSAGSLAAVRNQTFTPIHSRRLRPDRTVQLGRGNAFADIAGGSSGEGPDPLRRKWGHPLNGHRQGGDRGGGSIPSQLQPIANGVLARTADD